jgi:hypothetical protein
LDDSLGDTWNMQLDPIAVKVSHSANKRGRGSPVIPSPARQTRPDESADVLAVVWTENQVRLRMACSADTRLPPCSRQHHPSPSFGTLRRWAPLPFLPRPLLFRLTAGRCSARSWPRLWSSATRWSCCGKKPRTISSPRCTSMVKAWRTAPQSKKANPSSALPTCSPCSRWGCRQPCPTAPVPKRTP